MPQVSINILHAVQIVMKQVSFIACSAPRGIRIEFIAVIDAADALSRKSARPQMQAYITLHTSAIRSACTLQASVDRADAARRHA